MNHEIDAYNQEREFQHLAVEAVRKRVAEFTFQIEELDRQQSENGYANFNPEENAEMFGRSDITLQQYFYNEISNLRAGMSIISDKGVGERLFSEISALLIRIDKVFKPEDFIVEYIGIISAILTNVDNIAHTPGQSKHIPIALTQVGKMVSIFNSFIETRSLEIDDDTREEIIDINKLLIHHKIPEIITTQN
jgi:hypothetical protein